MSHDVETVPKRRVKADELERAAKAARLRVEGHTWQQIADECGYSHHSAASRSVKLHFGSTPAPDRAAAKALVRERAEYLWRLAARDAELGRPGAIRAGVALLQRISQLDGLDEPAQLELRSPTEAEYSSTVRALLVAHRQQQGLVEPVEADPFADEYLDAEVVEDGDDPLAPTAENEPA